MEGYVEHITKSWEGGGRTHQGYIVLVRKPGVFDTFEVGLGPLRRLLGLSRLTSETIKVLMDHKLEKITFSGKSNNWSITQESAEEWANKVKHLI